MPESKVIQACVNRKVSIFEKEHPDWEMKHVLAASYGYCRKLHGSKSDFFESVLDNCLKTDFYVEDFPVQEYSYLGRLTEDAYVDGHAHIIYPLKNLTNEQIQALFNAYDELRKAGVYFDTGYNIETNEREWHVDWSLKGAKVKVESLEEFKKWKKEMDEEQEKKDFVVEDIETDWKTGAIPTPIKPMIPLKPREYDWKALRDIIGMEGPTFTTPKGVSITGTRMLTDQPMTPIGSSTVKGAGVFNKDLLVQFHRTQGTYRYHFDTPEQARQSFEDLVNARSAGEFIWQQFRGHKKGEPVTADKIGPAYFSGIPTIGGTTASLVDYDIAGRTPQIKMPDYERLAEEMRKYKTMVKKPPESALEFTPEELIYQQRLKILTLLQQEFKKMGVISDFQEIEYIMEGTITRGGKFLYPKGWERKNYYQLKDLYQTYGHLPAFSAMNYEGHNENEVIGFGYDWKFTDPTEEFPDGLIDAHVYIFPDVIQKYNLSKDDLFDIPVSISQWDAADHRFTDTQYVTDLYNITVSLDKTLQDRCSLEGGYPCRMSIIQDGTAIINESVDNSISEGRDTTSVPSGDSYPQINKREDKPMPDENENEKTNEILKQLLEDVGKLKEDAVKTGAPSDTETGSDVVLFGEIKGEDAFKKACLEAGMSKAKCEKMWTAKMAKGTGADKGGLEEGQADKKTYDLAEIEEIIAKKIEDGITTVLTNKEESNEAEEIRVFLREKYGKEKCDFVEDMTFIELKAAKQAHDFAEKLYKVPEEEGENDVVSNNELFGPKAVQDFEKRQKEQLASLAKNKYGWAEVL